MNLQNLLAQIGSASNPLQMMMSMLNPTQQQTMNNLTNKPDEEKAQMIADYCNKNGITKEQLQNIISMFNKR